MAYNKFSLEKVKQDFGLTLVETGKFLPASQPMQASPYLAHFLDKNLSLALAQNTEKARSELVISPILLALKELLDDRISLFSGKSFSVDPKRGLNGRCDYLISRSPEQLLIEAPVVVIVEAKNENLNAGLGQCIAEMVAAQIFNQRRGNEIETVYGAVTTGNLWKFIRLQNTTVMLDLIEYPIPPIDRLLGILCALVDHPFVLTPPK